ncbi:Belongs to the ubiquitin-conjugating enzyme [Dionaea muscipula]
MFTVRHDPDALGCVVVVLWIQALELTEKPYFNEPGYRGRFGHQYWEQLSLAYNEDTFILCCKTTILLLRFKPKNFEPFVAAHFRKPSSSNAFKRSLERMYAQLPQVRELQLQLQLMIEKKTGGDDSAAAAAEPTPPAMTVKQVTGTIRKFIDKMKRYKRLKNGKSAHKNIQKIDSQ